MENFVEPMKDEGCIASLLLSFIDFRFLRTKKCADLFGAVVYFVAINFCGNLKKKKVK